MSTNITPDSVTTTTELQTKRRPELRFTPEFNIDVDHEVYVWLCIRERFKQRGNGYSGSLVPLGNLTLREQRLIERLLLKPFAERINGWDAARFSEASAEADELGNLILGLLAQLRPPKPSRWKRFDKDEETGVDANDIAA